MNFFLVLFIFSCIALYDIPRMIKNKQWKNLTIYSCLFVAVCVIGLLMSLDVQIPSPIKAIQSFYQNVLHLSFK